MTGRFHGGSCHKCEAALPCWGKRDACQRGFAEHRRHHAILQDHFSAVALKEDDAHEAFADAVATSPELRTIASTHLAAITDVMADRCYITRRRRKALRRALQQEV